MKTRDGATIRILKGVYMGLMYALFGLGIVVGLLIILPVVTVVGWVRGRRPERYQAVNSLLFGIWLRLLRAGGLLRGLPPRGRLVEGPCVIVANHPGLFDVLFLIRDIPRLTVLVKAALARYLLLGPVFRCCGYVLSPSSARESPVGALSDAIDRLERGYRFLLFPEGRRSPDGGLLPFKAGAFKIARQAGVPVQPLLIRNSPPYLPREGRWYYPPRETSIFEIEIWDPIQPPAEGEERRACADLEQRYREALDLT